MMGQCGLRLALVILLCLLLGTAVLAQGPAPSTAYRVEAGTVYGMGYQLAGGDWQVEGSARGPGYDLEAVGPGIQQGAGCCCTYLPSVFRNP